MKLTTEAIIAFKQKHIDNHFIRIGVKGSGCSGYSYSISHDQNFNANKDIEFNFDGLVVVIDNKSFKFLSECTIDFKKSLMTSEFVFENPIAKSLCGCKNSFSI